MANTREQFENYLKSLVDLTDDELNILEARSRAIISRINHLQKYRNHDVIATKSMDQNEVQLEQSAMRVPKDTPLDVEKAKGFINDLYSKGKENIKDSSEKMKRLELLRMASMASIDESYKDKLTRHRDYNVSFFYKVEFLNKENNEKEMWDFPNNEYQLVKDEKTFVEYFENETKRLNNWIESTLLWNEHFEFTDHIQLGIDWEKL